MPSLALSTVPASLPAAVRDVLAPAGDVAMAEERTRKLAHSHYENFSVVSFLLPKHLRQDFCNVYAFCRTADDLGDEVGDTARSLELLADFRRQLNECYAGNATSAIFVALSNTIKRHQIPMTPFADLIDAFEQDQTVNRYDTFDQLRDYCRRSADPVGRLVLYMSGYRDDQRQRLSDFTCTALQLTNFWQDVRRDVIERNRIYLPRESMDKFGVSEEQITQFRFDENYRRLMEFEVKRTFDLFEQGRALLPMLAPHIRRHIALFAQGGMHILRAIQRHGYDTLTHRPKLSRWRKGALAARALFAAIAQKFSREGR
jgi:squalene synthase HpnC